MGHNWFSNWFNSPYYHHLYFERDEKEAADFMQVLLENLQPQLLDQMLDIACGKGRHARFLAQKGYIVTGIDISPDSIAAAKEHENEHLQFFVHDMRLPFHTNFFDYAFNLFTSFGYFKTDREHRNAIGNIAKALKPGGKLTIDYLNVHFTEDHLVHQSEKMLDDVNYVMTRWYDEHIFYKKIVIEDEKNKEPLEFMEKVAKFNLGDFNEMLSYHRLQIKEVFGDYQLGHYDLKKSPRMILIAEKMI